MPTRFYVTQFFTSLALGLSTAAALWTFTDIHPMWAGCIGGSIGFVYDLAFITWMESKENTDA